MGQKTNFYKKSKKQNSKNGLNIHYLQKYQNYFNYFAYIARYNEIAQKRNWADCLKSLIGRIA